MKKAIIVGGGTGGHIIPAIVLTQSLLDKDYKIKWIGSIKSKNLENRIILNYFPNIKIYHIFSGKLRRKNSLILTLFNLNNILDIFQIVFGIILSIFILLKEKPDFIFSKGGFVSVPVAIASKILRIPFFTHESDYTVGLANKINLYFSQKFFYSFEDTAKYLPSSKAIYSSNPIRREFLKNLETDTQDVIDSKLKSFFNNINKNLPIILVLGGSLGSLKINQLIKEILPELCNRYSIIHQTGDNKELDFTHPNYCQISFIKKGVSYCMKKSQLIISRSGANLVFEIVATGTPAIFIPLKSASRGEQINNADYFVKRSILYSLLDEDKADSKILLREIERFFSHEFQKKIEDYKRENEVNYIRFNADQIIIENIEKEIYPK